MRRTTLVTQINRKVNKGNKVQRTRKTSESIQTFSTGSTLLDLAISGGRFKGGGIPGGILVEIFGPSGSGKTVLLCEIAGAIKRKGGEIMFKDPEARLNKQFALLFDLDIDEIDYTRPSTVPEVFKPVRSWDPPSNHVHGIFADSLAALSTDMEMDDKDQYGMRRAKEFSEELRKTCRILTEKNFLMVTSNQVRQNLDAGQFGQKWKSPGGEAIGFYSSLRLRLYNTTKIKQKEKVAGKEVSKVIGVKTEVEVFKSSIWEPYHTAPLTILFDYGIDDIRQNLQYIKDYTKSTVYSVDNINLHSSMEKSISLVEEEGLEKQLKKEVMELWEEIEDKFHIDRKPKVR